MVGRLQAAGDVRTRHDLGGAAGLAAKGHVVGVLQHQMGLVAGGAMGVHSVLIYLAAYIFMNVGVFASVIAVGEDAKTESIDGFSGLAFRSLPLALVTTVFLLSLTGIPPLAGFIGKFSLFSAVLQTPGLVWLAVVGAINSVISLAYYFSIVRLMFFGDAKRSDPVRLATPVLACLTVASSFTLVAGVFPNLLIVLVQSVWP